MAKKVADQLVETLVDANVKRIYAVTGDSLNEVNDAVRRNGKLQWVHVRHEETGAYAATAEAELNGIACCAGSSGPGHVHLTNGLYEAQRSNAPVLAIASTCATHEFGTAYFQETSPLKLFADCSGYNQLASTPAQFSRMLQGALQHCTHRREVAVIGLPGDVAAANAEPNVTTLNPLPSQPVYRPQDAEVKALADLINSSEKITLFCGIGAKDAHTELMRLAKRIKSPIAYTFRGKMSVQYDNPYEVGMTGLLGLPSAYESMHASDLLILIGTDFPYEGFMPEDESTTIVQLDVRPERIGRRAKVDMALAGNAKDTLQALLPLVEMKENAKFLNAQLERYAKVKEHLHDSAEKKGTKDAVAPEYVASLINRMASNDAIFTVDTGMCCVWGARYLQATERREMLGSFSHGSMANALPMAIGAAFARPKQQVVALCGDGGISMQMGDLATIAQYKLPVKLVVFNNRALGMVKLEMEVAGLPDWQTEMYNPDFAAVAEAMGIKGFSVSEPGEVENALRKAFAHKGPALVSVQTDPNALAMPPKVTFDQMKGFATAMTKLVLQGRIGDVVSTAKSNMKHLKEVL